MERSYHSKATMDHFVCIEMRSETLDSCHERGIRQTSGTNSQRINVDIYGEITLVQINTHIRVLCSLTVCPLGTCIFFRTYAKNFATNCGVYGEKREKKKGKEKNVKEFPYNKLICIVSQQRTFKNIKYLHKFVLITIANKKIDNNRL